MWEKIRYLFQRKKNRNENEDKQKQSFLQENIPNIIPSFDQSKKFVKQLKAKKLEFRKQIESIKSNKEIILPNSSNFCSEILYRRNVSINRYYYGKQFGKNDHFRSIIRVNNAAILSK